MKNLSTLFLFLAITSSLFSQEEMNKIVFDENANQEILLGYCDKNSLMSNPVTQWFKPEYDNYSIDKETLKSINPDLIPELEIFIVMGTWCSDSQREVPGFIKITELLNLQSGQLVIIGVNKNKEADEIPIIRMDIELVPTFIFYKDGEEIGRIVESPEESLEKDIVKFLTWD
ncbi:MAG: thioredoxin family protein [Bacteroidales bacterium]|nr:thioredoxin family protein [Bacteroidales bacterium]